MTKDDFMTYAQMRFNANQALYSTYDIENASYQKAFALYQYLDDHNSKILTMKEPQLKNLFSESANKYSDRALKPMDLIAYFNQKMELHEKLKKRPEKQNTTWAIKDFTEQNLKEATTRANLYCRTLVDDRNRFAMPLGTMSVKIPRVASRAEIIAHDYMIATSGAGFWWTSPEIAAEFREFDVSKEFPEYWSGV